MGITGNRSYSRCAEIIAIRNFESSLLRKRIYEATQAAIRVAADTVTLSKSSNFSRLIIVSKRIFGA
jgi:hypothetical protein